MSDINTQAFREGKQLGIAEAERDKYRTALETIIREAEWYERHDRMGSTECDTAAARAAKVGSYHFDCT